MKYVVYFTNQLISLFLDFPVKPDEFFEVQSLVAVAVVNAHHVSRVLFAEAEFALQQRVRLAQRNSSASVRIERLKRSPHLVHARTQLRPNRVKRIQMKTMN